jgi:hypothetical protein
LNFIVDINPIITQIPLVGIHSHGAPGTSSLKNTESIYGASFTTPTLPITTFVLNDEWKLWSVGIRKQKQVSKIAWLNYLILYHSYRVLEKQAAGESFILTLTFTKRLLLVKHLRLAIPYHYQRFNRVSLLQLFRSFGIFTMSNNWDLLLRSNENKIRRKLKVISYKH